MTSKLTRERIEWLNYAATGLAANGTEMAMSPQDVIALTECCLAAMDSEPVAWQIHTPETGVTYVETNPQSVENIRNGFGVKVEITPLYRHAQPVVPPELTRERYLEYFMRDDWRDNFRSGWDACRAAMLNGGKS